MQRPPKAPINNSQGLFEHKETYFYFVWKIDLWKIKNLIIVVTLDRFFGEEEKVTMGVFVSFGQIFFWPLLVTKGLFCFSVDRRRFDVVGCVAPKTFSYWTSPTNDKFILDEKKVFNQFFLQRRGETRTERVWSNWRVTRHTRR